MLAIIAKNRHARDITLVSKCTLYCQLCTKTEVFIYNTAMTFLSHHLWCHCWPDYLKSVKRHEDYTHNIITLLWCCVGRCSTLVTSIVKWKRMEYHPFFTVWTTKRSSGSFNVTLTVLWSVNLKYWNWYSSSRWWKSLLSTNSSTCQSLTLHKGCGCQMMTLVIG